MPSTAATGTAPLTPSADSLDRLLIELRRTASGDPGTTTRALLAAAATALGADTLVVWLTSAAGALEPVVHHPIGFGTCDEPLAGVAGTAPSVDALRADGVASVVRRDDAASVLDAGLWTEGALAGALTVRRTNAAEWSADERRFVEGLADRLAVEAVREGKRAAEAARREQRRQMDLIESLARLGSWEIDLRTDALVWSREQMRIHGVEPVDWPQTHTEFMRMVHPDDVDLVNRGMEALQSREPVTAEFRIVRPDGEIRLLQAQGVLVPGADGEYTRVLGTSLDITERRATELARRASEESYRTIFDASNDAIFVHDLETGAILEANRRACAFSDVSLEELKVRGLAIIANGPPPFTPERALAYMRRAAAGETVRFEWMSFHRGTNEPLWVEVSLQRVTILGVDRILALVRDIRDRKRAELALTASEEAYRQMFVNASDAMWLHDVESGEFLEINNAAVELYGYTVEEQKALGMPGISAGVAPHTPAQGFEHIRRAAAGEPQRFEWPIRHKDGRTMWAEVRLRRVTIGGVPRILATGRDIDDRKRAEQALRESEESYRTIFQHASDAMWLHDIDTAAFLEVNDAAVELLGYSADEQKSLGVIGTADGRPPYTIERGWEYVRKALAGEPQRFEWLARHKDGSPVWEEVSLRRVTIRGQDRLLATARGINDRKAAEVALRASEESYRTIFQHASDAMWIHDVDTGAFLEVNSAAVEMYGYSVDEQKRIGIVGISDGRPPFTPERAFEYLQRARAGEPQRFEWLGRHADGHEVWGEVRLRRVTIGNVDRILATARDINDRKAVEEELRRTNEVLEQRVDERTAQLGAMNAALYEREAQLRETQRIARLGSWQMDMFTNVLTWDPVVCELYGVTPETAPRTLEGYFALVHPDDREHARAMSAEARRTGQPFAYDHRVIHPDGTVRHLHNRGSLVALPDGTPLRMVGSSQDVTERKAAERALEEREAHFRRLTENTSDQVMIVDATGAITYMSPSIERLLGYTPEEMIGMRPEDVVHPDDVHVCYEGMSAIIAHPGETFMTTYRIRHKDGSWRVFESLGRTLLDHSAEQGVVAHGRDITERKAAAEALARAKEEAERANRAKSEFLSRMSHELRTPMNSILGFGQILQRSELAPQHMKSVQHILKAGRHLLHLINEVLEIARIEAGREHFSLEPVSVASVLQEAYGLVRPLAQQWEVELRDAPWPRDAYVQADRQRLVQVMLNLLSNAIKYNRRGGFVRLTCAATSVGWTIRVEDSGRGIPSDREAQLFTPFQRLGAEQTEVEGTGLGLALSRRLCEAMGGALALEQTSDAGSVFRVDLAAAEDPLRALEETGTHSAVAAPHRNATLLYVEDNLANLSLVDTILLSRPGWKTLPALQGQLGVELAREHAPDLILLDLHLPDISGEEVLRRLRSDARTSRIPVVIVSADATSSSFDRLRALGADAYLTKPLDVDEFLRVVERFLPEPGVES